MDLTGDVIRHVVEDESVFHDLREAGFPVFHGDEIAAEVTLHYHPYTDDWVHRFERERFVG